MTVLLACFDRVLVRRGAGLCGIIIVTMDGSSGTAIIEGLSHYLPGKITASNRFLRSSYIIDTNPSLLSTSLCELAQHLATRHLMYV